MRSVSFASLTFFVLNQMLIAVFDAPGRFLALVLIVLQLSAQVVRYPTENSSTVLTRLAWLAADDSRGHRVALTHCWWSIRHKWRIVTTGHVATVGLGRTRFRGADDLV